MELARITPEAAGIPSRCILDFLKAAEGIGLELHSLMFLRRGKVFAQGWWAPYNKDSRHIMFSFTKSLTSTAIGFARQEGFLRLEDRLVDIFPDKLPETPSENLQKCTIQDLLMMGCGHETEIPMLGLGDTDWIASFLHHPFVHEPGSCFLYNTAGTNMLAAILRKTTGQNLTEFLKPRLFDPIGMKGVVCFALPDGTEMGGAGSRLTTENMARFTQFVANKGSWEGKQLLESGWFDLATAKHIDNSKTGNVPDWQSGYGFQFWRCAPENTFRGDGAYGQFGVVCEKEEAVLIVTSASTNFQRTLDLLWDHIKPNFTKESLPEDRENQQLLRYVLENLQLPVPLSQRQPESEPKYSGKTYLPTSGARGSWGRMIGGAGYSFIPGIREPEEITALTVTFNDTECRLTADLDGRKEVLPVSVTSRYNRFLLDGRTYGAVGRWIGPDEFEFDARCAEAATGTRFTLHFSESGLTLSARPSIPFWGGLGDGKTDDIIFQLKK